MKLIHKKDLWIVVYSAFGIALTMYGYWTASFLILVTSSILISKRYSKARVLIHVILCITLVVIGKIVVE